MGTRSTITINDERGQPLVNLYQQFDGYLSGVGADLKDKFGNAEITNGIGGGNLADKYNGMGCFAASVIAHFKTGIGGAYIVPIGNGEEYNYTLSVKDNRIAVCVDAGDVLFDGFLADMPTQD